MLVSNKPNYIPEIDGLRALAVLSVMIFHIDNEYLPYGYLGVDIFFVISGYVICKAIIDRRDAGNFTINDFFMRRFRRLAPALTVAVITTSVFSLFLLPAATTLKTGATALFGMSNIALWYASHDYFAIDSQANANLHTWSLGVEEQFYLIFPFVLLYLKNPRLLAIAVGGTAFVSVLGYIGIWSEYKETAFYLLPFRLWELASGILIYLIHHYHPRLFNTHKLHRSLFKYALLAGLITLLFLDDYIPENYATVICVLLSANLLYLAAKGASNNVVLSNHITVLIGKMSYSLYLWHWPVSVYTKLIFPQELVLLAYISCTAGLSMLSYYLIERPFRYRNFKFYQDRFYLTFANFSVIVSIFIFCLWIFKSDYYLGPKQMQEVQFLKTSKCHLPGEQGLASCLKSSETNKSIFLIGDSHAGNYKIPLQNVAEIYGVNFQFLTGRALFNSLNETCTDYYCQEGTFQQHANHLSKVSKSGDIVVLSFASDRFYNASSNTQVFLKNISNFVMSLKTNDLYVILVEDIPKVCADDFEYLQSAFQPERCNKSVRESRLKRKELSNIFRKIASLYHLHTLDPHDILCDFQNGSDGYCSNMLQNNLLYLDSSPHFTLRTSASLTDFFEEGLRLYLKTP